MLSPQVLWNQIPHNWRLFQPPCHNPHGDTGSESTQISLNILMKLPLKQHHKGAGSCSALPLNAFYRAEHTGTTITLSLFRSSVHLVYKTEHELFNPLCRESLRALELLPPRCARTWSASISTVFMVNLREQKLKRSSRLGPRRSMTRTL